MEQEDIPKEVNIVASVLNIIIFMVGTIGNGLVIWLAGFKIEKTVCLIWYLNLAVADFFFCVIRILTVVREAMFFHWPFGSILCKINSFMKYLNLFASVLLLVVINVDRSIMVAHPIWCRIHRNIHRGVIVCFFMWVLATALSLPYVFYYDSFSNGQTDTCTYSADYGTAAQLVLQHVRFSVGFVIPLIVIIACNCMLLDQMKKRNLKTSRSSVRLILVVVIAFFVCWLPHHVFILIKQKYGHTVAWTAGFKIANFFAFFSSCINPVLYFFLGRLNTQPQNHSLISILSRVFIEDINSTNESERQEMQSGV